MTYWLQERQYVIHLYGLIFTTQNIPTKLLRFKIYHKGCEVSIYVVQEFLLCVIYDTAPFDSGFTWYKTRTLVPLAGMVCVLYAILMPCLGGVGIGYGAVFRLAAGGWLGGRLPGRQGVIRADSAVQGVLGRFGGSAAKRPFSAILLIAPPRGGVWSVYKKRPTWLDAGLVGSGLLVVYLTEGCLTAMPMKSS